MPSRRTSSPLDTRWSRQSACTLGKTGLVFLAHFIVAHKDDVKTPSSVSMQAMQTTPAPTRGVGEPDGRTCLLFFRISCLPSRPSLCSQILRPEVS